MGKTTDFKTCRYANCTHTDKKINITKDDYVLVGKQMYYHADCLEQKRKNEKKDEKTKKDLQYIKNQWVLHINKTVVYSQLFQVLNDYLSRGISSDYLVFVLDYVITHKMKLNYPYGLKYYVDDVKIKNAYRKKTSKKVDKSKFIIPVEDQEIETPPEHTPNIPKRLGFDSILKQKQKRN